MAGDFIMPTTVAFATLDDVVGSDGLGQFFRVKDEFAEYMDPGDCVMFKPNAAFKIENVIANRVYVQPVSDQQRALKDCISPSNGVYGEQFIVFGVNQKQTYNGFS